VLVIVLMGLLGVWRSWQRPFWDWLGLLIIPLVLAAGALWFNRQECRAQDDIETRRQESAQALAREERENNRDIASDRAREDALRRGEVLPQGLAGGAGLLALLLRLVSATG
jgi:hypothetical protein